MAVVALHRHVWNPQAEPAALLLHGLGSDGRTMWRLADALASTGLRVVAPDLRGHGLSPPAGSYDVAGYAADVRALGGGWALAVGHSLGGAILTVLLGEAGFAARGLLIDPVIALPDARLAELEAGLVAEVGGALDAERLRAEQPRWDDEDVHRKVRASELVSPRVVRRSIRDNAPWDLTAHVARWTVPVHVLAADPAHDALLPPDLAARIEAAGPSATVSVVAGAGHSIHRDDPEPVVAAVLDAVGPGGEAASAGRG